VSDLDRMVHALVAQPLWEPTPISRLRARARRRRNGRRAGGATAVVLVAALVAAVTWAVAERDGSGRVISTTQHAPTSQNVSILEVGRGTIDIATGAGSVWVTGPDTLRRIDPVANAVTAEIPVPGTSDYRPITAAFGSVWVTDTGTETLTRVDPTTNSIIASIPIPNAPTAMTATTDRLWIVGGDGTYETLTPVDPTTNTPGEPMVLEPDPTTPFPGLTAIADVLYVDLGPNLIRYDTRTGEIARRSTDAADLERYGGALLALDAKGTIRALDPRALRTVKTGARIAGAHDIAVDGDRIWTLVREPGDRGTSTLQRIDPKTLAPTGKAIEVGAYAGHVVADRGTAWVTNGALVRVDRPYVNPRPELCWRSDQHLSIGDGLPPASSLVLDPALVDRALQTHATQLQRRYPTWERIETGPGIGRGWVRDPSGAVTIVAATDYAIVVTLKDRRDCPDEPGTQYVQLGTDSIPILFAAPR